MGSPSRGPGFREWPASRQKKACTVIFFGNLYAVIKADERREPPTPGVQGWAAAHDVPHVVPPPLMSYLAVGLAEPQKLSR